MKIIFVIMAGIFFSRSVWATERMQALFTLLHPLEAASLPKFNELQNQRSLITFYQVGCKPCDQQLKELTCLASQGWQILAIGIGGDPLLLRQQLRQVNRTVVGAWLKSFRIAREHEIPGTPFNWIKSSRDQPWQAQLGVISCQKIQANREGRKS